MTQTPVEKPPYEALDFDGLERRGNYRIIAFREDILHIVDRNEGAATIYNIIERWEERHRDTLMVEINRRKKSGMTPYTPEEVEEMMWTYMSYNDFVRESGGALGYNTVIRLLHLLVEKDILKKRANRDPKYSDYEYRINKSVVVELLKALPVQPAFSPKVPKKKSGSTQMGTAENKANQSTQMGTGSTHTGIASTQMGTEVYPNGGTSHNTTHNTHILPTEEDTNENVASANSLFVSHPQFSFLSFDDLIAPSVMRIELVPFDDPDQPGKIYPYWSKQEEKRRTRIAKEVEQSLKAKGVHVRIEKVYKTLAWNEPVESDLSTPTEELSPANVENPTPSPSDKTTDTEASKQSPIAATSTQHTKRSGKILIDEWFALFDELYRELLGHAPNFHVSKNASNTKAILNMINAGVTREQAAFVFRDICNDKDPFWLTKRTITCVESQFPTRISRMNGHPAKTDRVNVKNANRATQSYTPEDYNYVGEVEQRQMDEFYAAHPELRVGA